MSFDFAFPTSYGELKDRVRLWANETGLASYASAMMGSGDASSRQAGNNGDSAAGGVSWQQDTFCSRIEIVQKHLNLSVRPTVLSGIDDIDSARLLLKDAYMEEPLFRWVLGNVKSDPAAARKTDAFLEWMVDWKMKNTISYSHVMAVPQRGDHEELALSGCALVTYPGSKTEIHQLVTLLKTGSAPPPFLGAQVKARFAAYEHMTMARDRLAGKGPHWYVHMLGVAADERGNGTGRMMMRIICALADQDALPVHLEVVGSRNKAFFEKCGFRAMSTMDLSSEDSPTIKLHLMTRIPFPKSIELV